MNTFWDYIYIYTQTAHTYWAGPCAFTGQTSYFQIPWPAESANTRMWLPLPAIWLSVWKRSRKALKSEGFWPNSLADVQRVTGCYFSKWQLSEQRSLLSTREECAENIQSDCCAEPQSVLANWHPFWSNPDGHVVWLLLISNCIFEPLNLLLWSWSYASIILH